MWFFILIVLFLSRRSILRFLYGFTRPWIHPAMGWGYRPMRGPRHYGFGPRAGFGPHGGFDPRGGFRF